MSEQLFREKLIEQLKKMSEAELLDMYSDALAWRQYRLEGARRISIEARDAMDAELEKEKEKKEKNKD